MISLPYIRIILPLAMLIPFGGVAIAQEKTPTDLSAVFVEIDSLLEEDKDDSAKALLDSIRPLLSQDIEDRILFPKLLGDYYLSQNSYREAVEAYQPILNLEYEELGKDLTLSLARAINDLGIAYQRTGKPREAIKSHLKSQALYDLYDDPQGGSYNYNNIAVIYTQFKMIDSALYFHKKSMEYAEMANDTIGVGFNLLGMGVLCADNKEPVMALDYLHQALDVFTSMNHESMINGTNRRIAVMYARLKDFESAIEIQKEVLAYYEMTKSNLGLGSTHNNIAELLGDMGELDSSKYHIDRSLEYFNSTGYAKGLAKAYFLEASYYKSTGAKTRAIESFNKAIEYSDSEPGMYLNSSVGLGKIYVEMGRNAEVIRLVTSALAKANNSASPGNLAGAYKVLSTAYKNVGNEKEALRYLERYNEQIDVVFDEDKFMEIARIEYRTQLEKDRALEKERQERVELEYQQELARERWIRMGTIGLAIFIGIIAILAYRAYKIKRSANIQLSEKNIKLKELRESEKKLSEEALASKERELATMAMSTHEKNAVLKDLEQKVSFIEQRLGDELKSSLKEMKKTISESYSLDKSWDSFIHRFEDVHPQFFDKLKSDNPNLTVEDLKLSAYIKIGMSNKEIANVTHLTLGSVKSKINRLKKKLEVGPEDSVRDYMLKYA